MSDSSSVVDLFRTFSPTNFAQVGLIIVGASLLIAASQRLLPWLAARSTGRLRHMLRGLVPMSRLLLIIAALILIVPLLVEPTIENLVAFLGALGLALAFAFKDYVSSLIAGVVSVYEAPYRSGDWIEINGAYGEVRAINMRSAEIVTPDDTVVIIPHLKFWDQMIFNSTDGGQDLLCIVDFYIAHDHNTVLVSKALYNVAITSAFLNIEKPISVVMSEEPWGSHYRLKAYPIDPREQFHFVTDLTGRGKKALIGAGVGFAQIPAIARHVA